MSAQGPRIAAVALSHSPQMAQDTEHQQGSRFRDGFARVAKAVADFHPTLIIYFGPDHMRALAGIAPCFTVVESATGYGDWGTPAEDYRVPHERAIALGQHLAEAGIDIALAPHLRLDHGFGQSTSDLFGSLQAVPLIPVVINCVDRPLPTAARTAALGRAVGEFLRYRAPGRRTCPGHRLRWHLPRAAVADTRGPRPDRRAAAAADHRQHCPGCGGYQPGLGPAVPRDARQPGLDPAG